MRPISRMGPCREWGRVENEAGRRSAEIGHHFGGRNNHFWTLLHRSGSTDRRLREKVARLRPRIVCLLGKDVYRAYAGLPRGREVAWELQASSPVPGVRTFVMPNPSARSTVPFEERLRLFRVLQEAALKPPDPDRDLLATQALVT